MPTHNLDPPILHKAKSSDTSTMIDALTGIWQRLFDQSSIGIQDDFFDLGGDSSLAVRLFTEVARVTGQALPPTMIYQARTVAALASLLEQPDNSHILPFVPLKAGTEKPPIFIAHGLGSVREIFQLVRCLELPHPIYGMQVRGIDGVSEPLESIEEMAQVYLDEIKQVQPGGPYFLVGYSFGGLVALEMAQRLSRNGDRVGLLAMVDSYPHSRHLSWGQRLRLFSRRAGHRIFKTPRPSVRSGRLPSKGVGAAGLSCPPAGAAFAPAMRRVRESAYTALQRYRPRFYPGSIVFVKAQISFQFPDDPVAVWAHLAAEFEVETVPGDHLEIVTTHSETLASVLTRHLKSALCRQ